MEAAHTTTELTSEQRHLLRSVASEGATGLDPSTRGPQGWAKVRHLIDAGLIERFVVDGTEWVRATTMGNEIAPHLDAEAAEDKASQRGHAEDTRAERDAMSEPWRSSRPSVLDGHGIGCAVADGLPCDCVG